MILRIKFINLKEYILKSIIEKYILGLYRTDLKQEAINKGVLNIQTL